MADKKISELDSASLPLAGTEIVPIVQDGVTKKVAVSEIGGDTPFDPSDYDLDEFTNESSDPFVRQSEVTTTDLDAVTQEGNVTRVEIVSDVSERLDENYIDILSVDYFGQKQSGLGWAVAEGKPFIKSDSNAEEILYSRKLFDFSQIDLAVFSKLYQNEAVQQDFSIVIKDDDFNANINVFYLCNGTLEITDPLTMQGYYKFFVLNGTTTIGTETYTQGASVQRYYDGSDWVSVSGGNPTLNDVALNGNTSTVPLKVSGDEGIASYGVDPDSGYPLLESDQNTSGSLVRNMNSLTAKRVRFTVNDDALEVTQINKNTNYTAINGQNYYNSGNIVVTDPSSGIYFVFVATGTTTIDSVAYPANTYLVRYLNASSVWVTRVLNATASPTVEGTTKLYDSLGAGTDGAVNRTVVTEELRRKANNLVLYNRTAWFAQRGSGGFGTIGITVANFVLSGNSVVAPTNTNGYTIQVRTNFATSATAGTLSFYRIGTDATIINTRFIFDGLFGFAGTTADTRFFYGLSTASTATPTNVAPTSLTNILAVSKLDSSNNLHVIHNDASGTATSIDLGANFPCDTNQTDTYYARFEVDTIGTVIYTVCRLNSDGEITHKTEGTITSDLPTDNTLLYHRAWITNNATASVSSFDFMGGSLGKN